MQSEVLAQLFRLYYSEAVLYVNSLCRNRQLAEDIVCDAFLKAFVTMPEADGRFKYWLLRVCKNAYIDHTRRHKTVEYNEDDEQEGNVEETCIVSEEYRALHRAISELAEPYRECVLLFYFSHLKVSEIAAITGKDEDHVRVLLYRARQKLKTGLEDHYGF